MNNQEPEKDQVKPPEKFDIRELVSRIPSDYQPEELDWGPPVGREVW